VLFNVAVNFKNYKASVRNYLKNMDIGGMILYRRNQKYSKNPAPLQL
jgi:hypothetical protein